MQSINVQDLQAMIDREDVVILDIRDKGAFNEFHFSNAISMLTTSLPNRLSELNKTTTYYVLSHSGRHSDIIAQFLSNEGIKAYHVIGGMKAFRQLVA